jgi:hypothetical protein
MVVCKFYEKKINLLIFLFDEVVLWWEMHIDVFVRMVILDNIVKQDQVCYISFYLKSIMSVFL